MNDKMFDVNIANDCRPIHSVVMSVEGGQWWAVGRGNVTKIEPYFENGQMARVSWLAIYEGDITAFRVNCAAVEYIGYDAARAP